MQARSIAPRDEIGLINSAEYIGALSDFTGEIGRMAVARASVRDIAFVRQVFETDLTISAGIMQLNVGGAFFRKTEAVNMNLKKVEEIVYELSILERGGRIKPLSSEDVGPEQKGDGAGDGHGE